MRRILVALSCFRRWLAAPGQCAAAAHHSGIRRRPGWPEVRIIQKSGQKSKNTG